MSGKAYSYFLYLSVLFMSGLLFSHLFSFMSHEWRNDPQFSHGFLIPLISLFLIWRNRNRLKSLLELYKKSNSKYSNCALTVVITGLFLYISGKYTHIVLVEGISFIVILLGSVLFVYGIEVFKTTFFPIIYLLFMIPIPARVQNFFSEPLQYMVARISAWIIALFGVPVFIKGELINIPSMTLQIEEVCAGLRTLTAFLAIGAAFTYLYIRSNWLRGLTLILAALVAVLMNIIRVSAVGIFAYFFNNEMGMNIHKYGWTFISILGFSIIFLMGEAFRCIESKKGY